MGEIEGVEILLVWTISGLIAIFLILIISFGPTSPIIDIKSKKLGKQNQIMTSLSIMISFTEARNILNGNDKR